MGDTSRIAKNTVALYIRMFVTLLINLYTSRVILKTLGIDDFGLYNAVGGVVSMFVFLKTTMAKSIQRFLSFELGKKDETRLRDIFSMSLTTQAIIVGILLLLAESLGLWFLNTQMNIPEGRETAANFVYQFSVLSLCITLLSVPFNACVISHERMSFFALISILDAVLKLAIAFMVAVSPMDRLIFYGALLLLVTIINFILFQVFCRRHFQESHYRFFFNKSMFKELFSFSSWTLLGQMSVIGANQGTNILMNIFHSVKANAAMGVAAQVNHALTSLVSSFQTAFTPQITKSFAEENWSYHRSLVYNASKVSFFLLFLVSLPIMLNMDFVLDLWLDKVPPYAASFCILFIIASIFNAIGTAFNYSVLASGNIRSYQIVVSVAFLSDVLIVYLLFKFGAQAVAALYVKVFLNLLVVFIRLYFAHRVVPELNFVSYFKKVLLPILYVVIICSIPSACVIVFGRSNQLHKMLLTLLEIVVSIVSVYYIGFNKRERETIWKMVKHSKK